MVSMRFPFSSFPQPPNGGGPHRLTSRSVAVTAAVCSVAAVTTAVAVTEPNSRNQFVKRASNFLLSYLLPNGWVVPGWGSLSLTSGGDPVIEKKTGTSFPETVEGSRRLLGVGLRRKSVFGLKNIDVYAFGVYADNDQINEFMGEKLGIIFSRDKLFGELMEKDVGLTVRLQIVYGKLSIGSVRSAFEVSVGSNIRKYGGSENKELLQRFTSQFKDDCKIPRGSIIDLSRERGNVLRTTIDGKEVGSIESKLLCQSVFGLYIGDDPFDPKAKEDVELKMVSLILR